MQNLDWMSMTPEELDALWFNTPETNECELTVERVTAVAYCVRVAKAYCMYTPKNTDQDSEKELSDLTSDDEDTQSSSRINYSTRRIIQHEQRLREMETLQARREEERVKRVESEIKARNSRYVDPEVFKDSDHDEIRRLISQYKVGKLPYIGDIDTVNRGETDHRDEHMTATHVFRKLDGKTKIQFVQCGTFEIAKELLGNMIAMSKVPKEHICVHEEVLGLYPFKAFLDIDFKKETGYKTAKQMVGGDEQTLNNRICDLLIFAFIRASFLLNGAGHNDTPYVDICNRDTKFSMHIIANDDGLICRNIDHLCEFMQTIKDIFAGYTGKCELDKYLCNLFATDHGILDMNMSRKTKFSLRMRWFEKIYDGTNEIVPNSKFTVYKNYKPETDDISSYFLQKIDIVRATATDTRQTVTMPDVDAGFLREVIDDICAKFPHYELYNIDRKGDVVATFNRKHDPASHTKLMIADCCVHGRKHDRVGAFLVASMYAGMISFTLYCSSNNLPSKTGLPKALYRKRMGFHDNSVLSILKDNYTSKTVENHRYMYGPNGVDFTCMINELPNYVTNNAEYAIDRFYRSACSTGKTDLIGAYIKIAKEFGLNALIISPRVTLSAKIGTDMGIHIYSDITKHDPNVHKISVYQFESLRRIPSDVKFDMVIIDEIAALVMHIESIGQRVGGISTNTPLYSIDSYRMQKTLCDVLSPERCKMLIAMDNDLSDDLIDALTKSRQNIQRHVYINTYKPFTNVNTIIDCEDACDVRLRDEITKFLKENIPLCATGKHRGMVLSTHKQESCKKYEMFVKEIIPPEYHHLVSTHYSTSHGTTEKKEIFGDINKYWADKLVVIYNQSVSVGISFSDDKDNVHFTHVFGDFEGMWHSITALQTVQSLFRCRKIQNIYMAIKRPTVLERRSHPFPVGSLADIAKHLAYMNSKITLSDSGILATMNIPGHIQAPIEYISGDAKAARKIEEYLGSSFITSAWVYNERVVGMTMRNVVGFISHLLKNVGINVEYMQYNKEDEIAKQHIDDSSISWKQFEQQYEVIKDQNTKKYAENIQEMIDVGVNSPLVKQMPIVAAKLGLINDPDVKYTKDKIAEIFEYAFAEDNVSRNYAPGEREHLRVLATWRMTPGLNLLEMTAADTRRLDTLYVQMEARKLLIAGKTTHVKDIAMKETRLVMIEYSRRILEEIFECNAEVYKYGTKPRINREELVPKDGSKSRFLPFFTELHTNAKKLLGWTFDRNGTLSYYNARHINIILNTYLRYVGASVASIKTGNSRNRENYVEVVWDHVLPIEDAIPKIDDSAKTGYFTPGNQ